MSGQTRTQVTVITLMTLEECFVINITLIEILRHFGKRRWLELQFAIDESL